MVKLLGLLGIVFSLVLLGLYVAQHQKGSQSQTPSPQATASSTDQYFSFTGTVVSQDFSEMPVDGDGVYKVKDGGGHIFTVLLTSGESLCDQATIKPVSIADGNKVSVNAEREGNNLRICDPGTYIKPIPPAP